jgi:hypothetical protein
LIGQKNYREEQKNFQRRRRERAEIKAQAVSGQDRAGD